MKKGITCFQSAMRIYNDRAFPDLHKGLVKGIQTLREAVKLLGERRREDVTEKTNQTNQ